MKTTLIGILITFFTFNLFSQSTFSQPNKKWRFGFDFGLNYSYLLVNKPLPIYTVLTNSVGYRLGIVSEYKLSEKLGLSPKIEFSLNNARLEFESGQQPYRIMPASIQLMCPVVFKTNYKYSPYFFVGPNLKIPVSKKSTDPFYYPSVLDFSVDLGIGIEERFSFFKFSPELRLSFGLINVNRYPGINYLYNNSVSLVLKFIE